MWMPERAFRLGKRATDGRSAKMVAIAARPFSAASGGDRPRRGLRSQRVFYKDLPIQPIRSLLRMNGRSFSPILLCGRPLVAEMVRNDVAADDGGDRVAQTHGTRGRVGPGADAGGSRGRAGYRAGSAERSPDY